MNKNAILSSVGEYTTFTFGGRTLTFMTSKNLEKYTQIKEWDNGYIVVMAKYKSGNEDEDYIDLLPILENLYMDAEAFLKPIEGVEIQYA
ncbi:MAG: hypothetical protein E7673_05835 [Ruminococcaceae bacterium]|nr:hypothetical protein [Oscillospiraceae bacterium]